VAGRIGRFNVIYLGERSSRNALWNSLALGVVIKVANPEMYLKDKTIKIIGRGPAG